MCIARDILQLRMLKYKTLSDIVPHLQQKLEQDCANIARVADVWKKEDKEIATYLTVTFEDIGNSKVKI